MAIVEQKTIESKDGVKKTIDKKSMGMALDILQRGLYSFPIKSTVRELASNAHDAVKERDVARAIISGETKVDDHYDRSLGEDGIYHSSGWHPEYFDLKRLSDDPYVKIYYEEGKLRDTLRIVDNGVGLGGERLLGYFQLNYSSKRANKDTLGRFGLGSKVPLSLGVESFRVINRYNGMLFKFDVYLDKIESVIPKFSTRGMNQAVRLTEDKFEYAEDGTETLLSAGYEAYWEPTEEKNGVEVQVEVKKHNKAAFFEGIESQLMYMPNILFLHKPAGSLNHKTVSIAAKIKYKDDNVIISEGTLYNKPHILLGTGDVMVNYGYVAFNELEIEPKGGAVGLIMDINDIEVTPSREAPVWSTRTRKAVLEKYEKVTETATKYVNEEIQKETDYIKWIQKATSIIGSIKNHSGDAHSVLSTLASIIDIGNVKNIKFAPDKTVVLKNDVEDMFGKKFLLRLIQYDRWQKKVKRDKLKDIQSLNHIIYYTTVGANKYKDRYIYEEEGRFVLITEQKDAKEFKRYDLIANSVAFKNYDTLEVPETRMDIYLDSDSSEDDDGVVTAAIDHKANRKKNKQISVHTAYGGYNGEWTFSVDDTYISDVFGLHPGAKLVYGTGNDRTLLKTIMGLLPEYYTQGKGGSNCFYARLKNKNKITSDDDDDTDPRAGKYRDIVSILVAKENLKYIGGSARFKTPYQLLVSNYNPRTKKLTLAPEIKFLVTARMIQAMLITEEEELAAKYGNGNFFYMASRTQKFHALFEGEPEYLDALDFMKESIYAHRTSLGNLPDQNLLAFFDKLGSYSLMDAGRTDASDEEMEKLLEELNADLPDFLCEHVDEIERLDAVHLDLFDDCMDVTRKLFQSWGIVSLYEGKYYYRKEQEKELVEQVKYFMQKKADDNDAIL